MRAGKDPKQKSPSGTLQETADLYLQSARLSPRTREIYSRLVRIHLASLANRPLGSIVPTEIDALHNRIPGKAVANAAIKVFRLLYTGRQRETTACPAIHVAFARANGTKLLPSGGLSLQRSLKSLRRDPGAVADAERLYLVVAVHRLCGEEKAPAYVGARSICAARYNLPAARIKTRKPSIFQCATSFTTYWSLGGNWAMGLFVFPSYGNSGHLEHVGAAVKVLRERTGIEFSVHDLRRTYATIGESCDISWFASKGLLNHSVSSSDVTGTIRSPDGGKAARASAVNSRLKAFAASHRLAAMLRC